MVGLAPVKRICIDPPSQNSLWYGRLTWRSNVQSVMLLGTQTGGILRLRHARFGDCHTMLQHFDACRFPCRNPADDDDLRQTLCKLWQERAEFCGIGGLSLCFGRESALCSRFLLPSDRSATFQIRE